ncbi:MAG TPA: hypothetical protein VFA21_20535 [Pyrinomonadaceae bacterium]|jgi:hypothetical protein|nr:hypothetical protein [Pyrinomonadaceae bacterium]
MPSQNDITRMRTTINRTLPDACTITRYTLVDDGRGGKKPQDSQTIQTSCRLSQMNSRRGEETVAETTRAQGLFEMTLPAGVVVLMTDVLTVNSVQYRPVQATDLTSYQLSNRFVVKRVSVT